MTKMRRRVPRLKVLGSNRARPTTASALAMQTGPSIGDVLLARMRTLEEAVTAAHAGNEALLTSVLATVRDFARAQDTLNSEVRRTMVAGPFSPDALSKMFQRMDNSMILMTQRLDTLCKRGHIHEG